LNENITLSPPPPPLVSEIPLLSRRLKQVSVLPPSPSLPQLPMCRKNKFPKLA
jgi:hypothetical protein